MKPQFFWLSAVGTAIVVALALVYLFPYAAIGLTEAAERQRGILLTLWTSGVLAVCFGAAGLLGGLTPLGFADVVNHGSVHAAIEARRDAAQRAGSNFYNFAGWLVSTGAILIGIYFALWLGS